MQTVGRLLSFFGYVCERKVMSILQTTKKNCICKPVLKGTIFFLLNFHTWVIKHNKNKIENKFTNKKNKKNVSKQICVLYSSKKFWAVTRAMFYVVSSIFFLFLLCVWLLFQSLSNYEAAAAVTRTKHKKNYERKVSPQEFVHVSTLVWKRCKTWIFMLLFFFFEFVVK